jgi:hypothetical protein
LNNREMLGIGNDEAPVRLIVLQLLYLLNRRLNVTSDGYGLKPSLNAYLSQFSAPKFEIGVGSVDELVKPSKTGDAAAESAPKSPQYVPAKDHSQVEAAPVELIPEPPLEAVVPAADPQPEAEAAVFDKPSPFASAPVPPVAAPDPVTTDTDSQVTDTNQEAVFDKPSPFASAPVPPTEEPAPAAAPQQSPAPVAPLGSAPIPSMKPAASAAEAPPAGDVIPPKPRVDFELDSQGDGTNEDKAEVEEDAYLNTVVMPPIATAPSKDAARNSTDAFIARVKEQLTTSEPVAENEKDSFSSTIPQ